MMRDTTQELERWLHAGGKVAGQIAIARADTGWELRHTNDAQCDGDDAGRDDLATFSKYEDARTLANLDDAGAYRALKTAPNLRHGWRLVLPDAHAVCLALDYFYPVCRPRVSCRSTGTISPARCASHVPSMAG